MRTHTQFGYTCVSFSAEGAPPDGFQLCHTLRGQHAASFRDHFPPCGHGQFLVLSFYTHCRVNTLGRSGSAGGFLEGRQWTRAPPPRWPPAPPTDTDCAGGSSQPRRGWVGRSVTSPDQNQRRRSASWASACPLSYKGPVCPLAHLSERRTREKGDLDSLLSVSPMFSLLCLSFKRMFLSLTEVLSCLHNPPVSSGLAPLRAVTSWKRGSPPSQVQARYHPAYRKSPEE